MIRFLLLLFLFLHQYFLPKNCINAAGIQTIGGPTNGKNDNIAVMKPHKNAPFIPNIKNVIVIRLLELGQ
jgi:hypothetical protein